MRESLVAVAEKPPETPTTGRHSTSWAMRNALVARDLEPLPEELFFGLGASAWAHLDARGGSTVLRGVYPDRLVRALFALNIWATKYTFLSLDEPFEVLEERNQKGLVTFVNLERRALDGRQPLAASPGDHTVLIVGFEPATGGSEARLQVLMSGVEGPTELGASDFCRAWYLPVASPSSVGFSTATFYMHPFAELHWDQDVALRRSLLRFTVQMQRSVPSLGATGLAAIEAFAGQLAGEADSGLELTARLALEDGGEAFYRDLWSAFLRHAAERLSAPALERAAERFAGSAEVWSRLLSSFLSSPCDRSRWLEWLEEIRRLESSGVELIAGYLAESNPV